jgi:hypothetical protein
MKCLQIGFSSMIHFRLILSLFGSPFTDMGGFPDMFTFPELGKITRVVLVDHTKNGEGRAIDKSNVYVDVSIQDDGKTFKLFLTDRK